MLFRQDPTHENTPLHLAILERDTARALEILPAISKKDLNKKVLGNTPLMLALKTANFAIARAILERDDVEVVPEILRSAAMDSRGVTPLHLACAWRENDLIEAIFAKYRDYFHQLYGHEIELNDFFAHDTAAQLGIRTNLQLEKFPGHNPYMKHLFEARTLGKIYREHYKFEDIEKNIQSRHYHEGITDSDKLILDCAPELTDALLFHSKSICLNLGLKDASEFKEYPSSQHTFAQHLSTGLRAILEYRNQKPTTESIHTILGTSHPAAANPSRQKHRY